MNGWRECAMADCWLTQDLTILLEELLARLRDEKLAHKEGRIELFLLKLCERFPDEFKAARKEWKQTRQKG